MASFSYFFIAYGEGEIRLCSSTWWFHWPVYFYLSPYPAYFQDFRSSNWPLLCLSDSTSSDITLGLRFLMGSLVGPFVPLVILLSPRVGPMFLLLLFLLSQLTRQCLLILSMTFSLQIPLICLHLILMFDIPPSPTSVPLPTHPAPATTPVDPSVLLWSDVNTDWAVGLHDGRDYSIVNNFRTSHCRVC